MEASLIWFAFSLIRVVLCFQSYQSNIPNGNNVPHPCNPGIMWLGVGHKLASGGKNRNYFGKDFASAGNTWTQTLCRKDSDGDGKTNGEELGDPSCIWSQGQFPERSRNITHPGVCEPWNNPQCQEQWGWLESECKSKDFVCDGINGTGVQNMTVQFPVSKVPSSQTTYICIIFDLPQDKDYHLIATKPLIDNINIVHHAVLFGCEDDVELEPTPEVCDMVPSPKCREILSTWTVGFSGDCVHNRTGFRMGINGYKRAALQFHWNNPALYSTYTDQSGLILYYTEDLRTHDAGILTVGANYLNIKPGVERTTYVSYCPAQCTEMFIKDKVYIASAHNHMHYLGISQKIEQYRNGSKLKDITSEILYNYDNPKGFRFNDPIELLAGDTIKTTCVYNSLSKNTTTYFGDSTTDEMCFGFITYFPKKNLNISLCTSWKSLPMCVIRSDQPYQDCYLREFLKFSEARFMWLFNAVLQFCDKQCSTQCLEAVEEIEKLPCLTGEFRDYVKHFMEASPQFRKFFTLFENCLKVLKSNMSIGVNQYEEVFMLCIMLICIHAVLCFICN